jgi:hypothetical protein
VSQVTSVVDMAVEIIDANGAAGGSISFLRTFRIFRALRPLRIISRSKGLKLVLQTVTRAIIPVMNTILIALAVFFVFGIMAVQLLGGRTAYCTDITIETKLGCQGVDPHSGEIRLWRQRQLTYGNIGDAMLSMFILASQVPPLSLPTYTCPCRTNALHVHPCLPGPRSLLPPRRPWPRAPS